MSDTNNTTQADVTMPVKGNITFGLNQAGNPTPLWARWIFRVFAILTTAAVFIIASDPAIPDALKVRIGVYLKGADMVVLGLANMFGVNTDKQTT